MKAADYLPQNCAIEIGLLVLENEDDLRHQISDLRSQISELRLFKISKLKMLSERLAVGSFNLRS